jgi:hypothetical protein
MAGPIEIDGASEDDPESRADPDAERQVPVNQQGEHQPERGAERDPKSGTGAGGVPGTGTIGLHHVSPPEKPLKPSTRGVHGGVERNHCLQSAEPPGGRDWRVCAEVAMAVVS